MYRDGNDWKENGYKDKLEQVKSLPDSKRKRWIDEKIERFEVKARDVSGRF